MQVEKWCRSSSKMTEVMKQERRGKKSLLVGENMGPGQG